MSVVVGQRNVKDTPFNNKCYAVDATLDLALHTLKICNNENIFTPEYKEITCRIIDDSIGIYLNADRANMISKVLDKQHIHGNSGYNPGSQMVQIAALTALNDLDHIIKEQLHIKHYIRYNDDFWILHESKEFLENCLEFIKTYLEDQGFELNTRKTVLKRLDAGFVFLGFNYRITETGKIIMILNSDNVKHEKKKLRHMVNKCKRGEISKAKIDESYNDWKEFANEGNSYKLIQRMDKYYAELWRDL